ncbi:general stress protein [Chryseomicrobium palamuruense]|uniref:General stress protein n=1 Tax=Chryseomicrobium palamuruense TaxID=682973 RepID=A0ABV8UTH2_9BACL
MENNRHVEVAWSQEELNQKIETLRAQGYNESDIHVVARDPERFQLDSTDAHVDTHEAGSFWDRFKSFFTGEDATTESLGRLNLEQHEQEMYATDLTNGGAILYVEGVTRSDDYETFGETGNSYESYHGETTNGSVGTEFVNQRFNQNETPLGEHTPEENRELFSSAHNSYKEDEIVQDDAFEIKPQLTSAEKTTSFETAQPRFESDTASFTSDETTESRMEVGYEEQQAYGAESPGADPNLGPAAFGNLEPAMEDEGREPNAIEDSLANHEHEDRVEEIENRRSENHMQHRDKY